MLQSCKAIQQQRNQVLLPTVIAVLVTRALLTAVFSKIRFVNIVANKDIYGGCSLKTKVKHKKSQRNKHQKPDPVTKCTMLMSLKIDSQCQETEQWHCLSGCKCQRKKKHRTVHRHIGLVHRTVHRHSYVFIPIL